MQNTLEVYPLLSIMNRNFEPLWRHNQGFAFS